MISEYYAPGKPKSESILKCEDCGEERRVRRTKQLLEKNEHPCRPCSNKRNGKLKEGVRPWNYGVQTRKEGLIGKLSILSQDGYTLIWMGKSEKNKDGYVREHRKVVEDNIGRELLPKEIVHHINGAKTDNRLENLYLCENMSKHRQAHNSLEDIAMELVQEGIISFDKETGRYYR